MKKILLFLLCTVFYISSFGQKQNSKGEYMVSRLGYTNMVNSNANYQLIFDYFPDNKLRKLIKTYRVDGKYYREEYNVITTIRGNKELHCEVFCNEVKMRNTSFVAKFKRDNIENITKKERADALYTFEYKFYYNSNDNLIKMVHIHDMNRENNYENTTMLKWNSKGNFVSDIVESNTSEFKSLIDFIYYDEINNSNININFMIDNTYGRDYREHITMITEWFGNHSKNLYQGDNKNSKSGSVVKYDIKGKLIKKVITHNWLSNLPDKLYGMYTFEYVK